MVWVRIVDRVQPLRICSTVTRSIGLLLEGITLSKVDHRANKEKDNSQNTNKETTKIVADEEEGESHYHTVSL